MKQKQSITTKITQLFAKNTFMKILFSMIVLAMIVPASFSQLELLNVYYDPAIITAGDEVDIVVEYRASNIPIESSQIGSREFTYDVRLLPDSELSSEYITIIDSTGKNLRGGVLQGVTYNKVFRVKVDTNAPAVNFPLRLEGQWFRNNQPFGSTQFVRIDMPVKREGIILDVAGLSSTPSKIRPGDTQVQLSAHLENAGFKTARSVEVHVESEHEGIVASFSNNNRILVGLVEEGTSKPMNFYIDVRDSVESGVHNLHFTMNYRDLQGNSYTKNTTLPILVESRPHLIVTNVEGSSRAGEKGQMIVEITNIGEDSANAVDVRIIRDATQPFAFDLRSNFIGEIKPNESRIAIFEFDTLRSAEEKVHQFQLLVRAQGDRDKGDTSIYTFHRRAEFEVSGQALNWFLIIGGGITLFVVLLMMITFILRKQKPSSPPPKHISSRRGAVN